MKINIKTINIHLTPSNNPPSGLIASLAIGKALESALECQENVSTERADLPAIGEKWPGTEAIYAGKSLSRDGSKIIDLIVWLDESNSERNFEDNLKYCESVNPEMKSHAATRQQP